MGKEAGGKQKKALGEIEGDESRMRQEGLYREALGREGR